MLFLFPCVMQGSTENISFYRITIFFACGIVSAALTAQQIATFPNISQFITVDSYLTTGIQISILLISPHALPESSCCYAMRKVGAAKLYLLYWLWYCYIADFSPPQSRLLSWRHAFFFYGYRSYWKRGPPAAAFACLWDSCVQELSLLLHQLSKHCFRLLMTVLLKHPTCLSWQLVERICGEITFTNSYITPLHCSLAKAIQAST